jgi:hypothetical protein
MLLRNDKSSQSETGRDEHLLSVCVCVCVCARVLWVCPCAVCDTHGGGREPGRCILCFRTNAFYLNIREVMSRETFGGETFFPFWFTESSRWTGRQAVERL